MERNSVKKALNKQAYGGRDPASIPFCTIRECAAWLDLPASTVRSWFYGQKGFKSVLLIADPDERALSFVNVTEVFVLAAIRRAHKIDMRKVRSAVEFLRERFRDPHPLARQEMLTEGSHLLVHRLESLISASERGQLVLEPLVQAHLKRVDRDAMGQPTRLYPFTRHLLEGAPSSVVIDPRVQFGRPCLSGTGIPTSVIHERFLAGEDIGEIARDYGRKESDVQEAIRFEHGRAA